MTIERYQLGLPMWGMKDWLGTLYRRGSRPGDFLAQYASVFNTVEGNTTFYSLPRPEIVQRWREQVPAGFRFCFKLNQEITHRLALRDALLPTNRFLQRLAPLGDRLGPFMIQLPPSFGPARLERLERFLRQLPPDFRFGVELRHAAFGSGEAERRVNGLLEQTGHGRIIVDSRALRSGDTTPEVEQARANKPNLPVHPVVTAGDPMVRFVGHPDPATTDPWLDRWAGRLQGWIEAGLAPYLFVHVPDNAFAPGLAARFHERLAGRIPVGDMPTWPGRGELDEQMRLL